MRMGEWILNGSRRGCLCPCSCVAFPAMNKDTLIPNEQNPLIWINPERMGGAPCFYGTRLPVNSLFENLEAGVSIDEWLDAFPSVTREQAVAVLEYAPNRMLEPVAGGFCLIPASHGRSAKAFQVTTSKLLKR